MPTAILIGFEYTFNSLVGAIIDLYHAYRWCSSFGCDIHVLSDITTVKDENNLKNVVDRKIADADLLTFYDKIAKRYPIKDRHGLLTTIIGILEAGVSDDKLIIYYSGHGVKDSMVMPDRTLVPFIDFRDNILQTLHSYIEIFWILDCCNPNGLHLPYRLEGNIFVLSSSKIECVSQPILLITSSESNEKSIATKYGSVFSRHLFRILTIMNDDGSTVRGRSITIPIHKNRNLRRLIGNLSSSIRKMQTGYAQTVSIYSSYVVDPVLWMWIGSNKNYDIAMDLSLSMFILRTSVQKLISSRPQNNITITNPYDLMYPE